MGLNKFTLEFHTNNEHWLNAYGHFLIFLSKVNMEKDLETLELIDYPDDESEDFQRFNEGVNKCSDFFSKKQMLYVEGYTLRELSKWFIWYCKDWHTKNKATQLRVKKEKLESLKKEISELENK